MSKRNQERKHKTRVMASLTNMPNKFKNWLAGLSPDDFERESKIAVDNLDKIANR